MKYGITHEEFEALIDSQEGRCPICRRVLERQYGSKMVHLDHDHETGEIRGVLCSPCNRGIGYLGDDADRLATASEYLRKKVPVCT